jgi:hypothetical protein
MSTINSIQNNDAIPNIRDRKDVIILSADIECLCGRLKDRAHCPVCGKIKLYGRAVTEMAMMPNGDVVKDCKTYRCSGCAEVFNDVAWYFNCHAPKKIDMIATKKLQAEHIKNYWMERIATGEKFDYNTRTKCIAQSGLDPWAMQELMMNINLIKAKEPTQISNATKIERCKQQIATQEENLRLDPTNEDIPGNIEILRQKLRNLENE